ncbi:MAG: trypsin-like peptidase domain-containing protein [Hyphomicrobiaceae bacterium]|nr:trypsin-like peptidase domain-containing protein [Hyphomicrobiaceae bacterium]
MFRRALIAGLVLAFPLPAQAQPPATPLNTVTPASSQGAREVLTRVRPAVVQIKSFFGANTAQASHGTGFAVKEGGVFITNYHVVAERVQHPGKYRLEYCTADGQTGPLSVLAVDVRHDLALVRAAGYEPPPLELQPSSTVKGDRAYSVGFPLDVGLTITEGISNGKVEDSFEPRIHYSGAINAGMSGGPGLDAAGEVIGVNVSGYRFEQLVSFLVPVAHVRALRDRSISPLSDLELKREAAAQMLAHSTDLLGALNGAMKTQAVAGYILPDKIAPFINCNASGNAETDDPVQMVQVRCEAKAGLYIQQGLYSGDLKYAHYVLTTDRLDALRFTNRLSGLTQATGRYGTLRHVGPYACQDHIVGLKGFDASLLVCARRYRRFERLYDFTVRVNSLNSPKQGYASHLDIYGVEFEPGMKFIRRYVEAMEWRG